MIKYKKILMENHESKSMRHEMRLHNTQRASPTQDQTTITEETTPTITSLLSSSNLVRISLFFRIWERGGDTCDAFPPRANHFFLSFSFFGYKLWNFVWSDLCESDIYNVENVAAIRQSQKLRYWENRWNAETNSEYNGRWFQARVPRECWVFG